MIQVSIYNGINYISEVSNFTYPKFFVPTPSKKNYEAGYVRRFFVQKVNSSDVIEVSESNYGEVPSSFFRKTSIKWVLTGTERNVYNHGKLYETGVYEANQKLIQAASKEIPNIGQTLTNRTQFFVAIKN